jgi:hypothetical protein
MSNIQISALGAAFLANPLAASAVAAAIVEKKHDLLSEKGLVVETGPQLYTVQSAAVAAAPATANIMADHGTPDSARS